MGSTCKICRVEISDADFESGRAVTLLRRHYCSKCSSDMARESEPPGRRGWSFAVPLLIAGVVLGAGLVLFGLWLSRRG